MGVASASRRWASLISLMGTLALFLGGCGCSEAVIVRNQMAEPVHLQLALPWPSYKFSAGESCQYDVFLDPASEWRSRGAASDGSAAELLTQPNGPMVFRVRPATGPWSEFALMTDEILSEIDPVLLTITGDASGGIIVTAVDAQDRPLGIEEAEGGSFFRN